MTLINRYAYLILTAGAIVAVWAWSWPLDTPLRIALAALTPGAAALVWFALRPAGATVAALVELDARRGRGRPILIDFFSPY
jgi:hypothetical protein